MFCSRKLRRSLHQPALTLKAHKEAIMRFSQVYCPDGLDIFLSQGQGFENSSHCGYREQNIHLKDRGGCEESPVAWVQFMGQVAFMSYGRPSPMCLITGSYNLIDTPRGQQGLPLAWRWLVWWLSGCSRGRYHGSNRSECKINHI